MVSMGPTNNWLLNCGWVDLS